MEQPKITGEPEVIYADIKGDDEPTIIDSLCVECEKDGKTTIMLTKIPMFKEIIVTSFYCEHCGYKNTDTQFGGQLGEFAQELSLKCTTMDDFKRDVVRSEYSTIKIPELDLEIPNNKKGQINTIEGFLENMIEDLQSDQEERKEKIPEVYDQIAHFIKKIQQLLEGQKFPFHFVVEDPAGNSFIKNPFFPKRDPNLINKERVRTLKESELMGYSIENEEQYKQEKEELEKKLQDKLTKEEEQRIKDHEEHREKVLAHKVDMTQAFDEGKATEEALVFPINCHCCMREGLNKMCVVSIPYFKEITLMSFNCEYCGAKNSEVKVGGGLSQQALRITLNVENENDLKRDLFKSETCGLTIPELDLELVHGTLGGVYTTVEGLLEKIGDNLVKNNPFADSDKQMREKLDKIYEKLEEYREGKTKFTLILEDMCEDSFIQNPNHPNEDPNCVAEKFDRTPEMEDELGINHMKV